MHLSRRGSLCVKCDKMQDSSDMAQINLPTASQMEKDPTISTLSTVFAVLSSQMDAVNETLKEFKQTIKELGQRYENMFATKTELVTLRAEIEPMKKVVYGLVALILIAVVSAVVYMVIKK